MDKWKELYKYYKENSIKCYEDYFGVKFTKFQKIKFKIYDVLVNHLQELIYKRNEIRYKTIIGIDGTIENNILEIHYHILDIRITIIKEILRIR